MEERICQREWCRELIDANKPKSTKYCLNLECLKMSCSVQNAYYNKKKKEKKNAE